MVWGHRGSRTPGPENTPAAVRNALVAGADGSEVDVRRAADGRLMCHHDPALGDRPLIELTAAEAAAGGVALMSDVIRAGVGGRLVLEVKNAFWEPDFSQEAVSATLLLALLEELRESEPALPDVLISSFDHVALDVARDAGWPTALLTLPGVSVAEGLTFVRDSGYRELHAHVSDLLAVDALPRDRDVAVVGWTVVTVSQALELDDRGVDAVICDDPAGIVGALFAAGRS